MSLSGGCQCGAVRFRVERWERASICHCRMCQKASGGFFGPFADVEGLTWTRGQPKSFQSSNMVRRGFCEVCGTPLSFEAEGGKPSLSIGAFDDPSAIAPALQMGEAGKLPYADGLAELPGIPPSDQQRAAAHFARIVSYQHPDHDTEAWPPKAGDGPGEGG
ncbi:MAG TPA: GFA family protein [Phenylobacterium sp.]|jgi:hypothetical protein|nr:GFA family protein [Phenylobacterium sp.]